MNRLRTSLAALAIATVAVTGAAVGVASNAAAAPLEAVATAAASPSGVVEHGHPVRTWWRGLTGAQRQCLRDAHLTRPLGRLNAAERASVRAELTAAAQACGITLPALPKAAASAAPGS